MSCLPANFPRAELQTDPLRHVEHVRVDRTGRADVVDVRVRNEGHDPVDLGVRLGDVRQRRQRADARVALAHAERREDPLLNERVPVAAGGCRGRLSSRQIHDVLIAEVRTEAPRRLEVADATKHVRAIERAGVPQQIATREPAAMRQRVTHAQLACGVEVVHLEARQIRRDRGVPLHLCRRRPSSRRPLT